MPKEMESAASNDGRPRITHASHSDSRGQVVSTAPARSRASTLSHGITGQAPSANLSKILRSGVDTSDSADIFDGSSTLEIGQEQTQKMSPQDIPEGFDELPIELISLIDRSDPIIYSFYPFLCFMSQISRNSDGKSPQKATFY